MEVGFEEFAAVETARLFGLARVLCGNDHDAWDLTQEALARVSSLLVPKGWNISIERGGGDKGEGDKNYKFKVEIPSRAIPRARLAM